MKTDMSPEAVTVRLQRTEQLRRLCLTLQRGSAAERAQAEKSRALESGDLAAESATQSAIPSEQADD